MTGPEKRETMAIEVRGLKPSSLVMYIRIRLNI